LFTTNCNLHHADAMPQKPDQILDPQATFSSAYYCGCVVDGHIPCDTNVALCCSSSSDCQSDSAQSLFDPIQIVDHDVDIALLEYEIPSQLRPTHSHAADFFF
jgi:hypothetical protein